MVELRNEAGVRVTVSEETAARLGPGWVRPEQEPEKRKPGRPKKSE